MVGKGRGIAGLGFPLVETLRGPVGVRVARTVLVIAIAASRVVSESGGVVVGGPLAKTADTVLIDISIVAVHTDTILGGDLVIAIDTPHPLVGLARGGSTGRE